MANYALKSGAASSAEDLLDQIARIPGRKFFNALLAVLQLPHATLLCSAEEWAAKWGRRVRPEERPLVLLFPFGPVEFVYDLSQTEETQFARPLPIDAAPFAMAQLLDAGESVARLSAALQELGVRVVSARQGTSLAGKIRRVEDAGVLRIPSKVPGEAREVPVRWIIALNQSHSPTEHLVTLAHELGHLFCGHVSADQGDPWPNRPGLAYTMREFEAESVARLVFRRIAPTAELPPYLEHILDGEEPPDQGWTYVAQAADTVIEMLGVKNGERVAIEYAKPIPDLPAWAADLVIRRGDPESTELIIVRATNDEHGLPERVTAAWAAGAAGQPRPWIVAARSVEAFNGLSDYFRHAPGEDDEHDAFQAKMDNLLPLASHQAVLVSAGRPAQATLVEVSTDPPGHGGNAVSACLSAVQGAGISGVEPDLNTDWMYTWYSPPGDLGWSEQVLGWDDMYSSETWDYLQHAERLFIKVRPDAGLAEPLFIERLAGAISAGLHDLQDYYAGVGIGTTRPQRRRKKRACPQAAEGGPQTDGGPNRSVELPPRAELPPQQR